MFQISDQLHGVRFAIFGEGGSAFLISSTSQLFEGSSQIIIIIAATRMHRSLVNFASGSSDVYDTLQFLSLFLLNRFRAHENPQASNLTSSKTKRAGAPSTAMDRVEIAMHTAIEQHPTCSMKDDDSSTIISTSEQTPEMIGHPSKASLVEHPLAHAFC